LFFPPTYKILPQRKFTHGEFSLIPIRYEDRLLIMQWRNEQIYHLRQQEPLTREAQDKYFSEVVAHLFEIEQPDQLLFSFLKNDKLVGYGGLVHINWKDRNAEISFIINTELEKNCFEEYWVIYLQLLEQAALGNLQLHKIYTYAFDMRPHLYKAVEKAGFIKEAALKEHCLFDGKYIDVVIHSRINHAQAVRMRRATEDDVMLYFEWANDPAVRQNAIHTAQIAFEDHRKWFTNKLHDPNSKLFVFYNDQDNLGQLRLDKEGEFWIISYTVDERFRGQGWGKIIVQQIVRNFPQLSMKALVKEGNIPSIKIFEKCGFQRDNDVRINDQAFLVFTKSDNRNDG